MIEAVVVIITVVVVVDVVVVAGRITGFDPAPLGEWGRDKALWLRTVVVLEAATPLAATTKRFRLLKGVHVV